MASIRKETIIDAPPERVWDALRDWGAPHERLVPGFVVDTRLDGTDRIVTFFTGTVVREVRIDLDDQSRRLAWSIVDGEGGTPYEHHNGSAQVFADGHGRTKFVWITDLLPEEQAQRTSEMMERGTQTIKQTQERTA
jgi:uncharacterized protein YndB with AHSA1/START domain